MRSKWVPEMPSCDFMQRTSSGLMGDSMFDERTVSVGVWIHQKEHGIVLCTRTDQEPAVILPQVEQTAWMHAFEWD